MKLKDLPIGAVVKNEGAKYDGKVLEWIVVGKDHSGYPSGSVTLHAKYGVGSRANEEGLEFDAEEPNKDIGNNNPMLANLTQWLESDGSKWYTPQHKDDKPPTYEGESGFLYDFSSDMKSILLPTKLQTRVYRPTEEEKYNWEWKEEVRKVFLLNEKEVGFETQDDNLGSTLEYYKGNDAEERRIRTYYGNNPTEWDDWSEWWLRASNYAPKSTASGWVATISDSGKKSSTYPFHDALAIPAINVPSDLDVAPNNDGGFDFIINRPPTLTLDTPNNQTLYEGSKINIEGTAQDLDVDDAVIVKYEIASSGEKILTTETPKGKEFSYGKVLTFTNSKIYDGSTAITKELKEDNTYTLTVRAQDDKGATSKKLTRQFTVVPNRAPILEITKTPNVEGVSKHETFTIEGAAKDLDGDDIKITYTHNGGKKKTVKLTKGKFVIDLKLTDLKEGRNTFIVTATDDYGASTAREIRVDMKAVKSDVDHIENKIYYNLPLDKVTDGLLVWVRRPATDNTDLKGYSSITDGAEDFKAMEKTTGIFQNRNRDEFIGTSDTPGSNLKLKFEFDGDAAPIEMIQGVIK